jgi:hypothetical protein
MRVEQIHVGPGWGNDMNLQYADSRVMCWKVGVRPDFESDWVATRKLSFLPLVV